MINYYKFDRLITGIISGLVLPFIVGLTIYAFSAGDMSIREFLSKLAGSKVITHSISLCVFPNVFFSASTGSTCLKPQKEFWESQ